MKYFSNAFSLGMLPIGADTIITELDDVPDIAGCLSVVGHADTAAILGVPFNRQSIRLGVGDILIVAQYDGPRLPEGSTTLPNGASFRWFKVVVK